MTKAKERYQQGRIARLSAEVNSRMHQQPIKFQCVYKRLEQRNQYKRGWDSVTEVDIRVAVNQTISNNIAMNSASFGSNRNIY